MYRAAPFLASTAVHRHGDTAAWQTGLVVIRPSMMCQKGC